MLNLERKAPEKTHAWSSISKILRDPYATHSDVAGDMLDAKSGERSGDSLIEHNTRLKAKDFNHPDAVYNTLLHRSACTCR